MATDPSMIRASDRDRDHTADLLREHHAAGRLDPDEFSERLDKVFAAKTIGDLDDLTADLPAISTYPLPAATLPRDRSQGAVLPASTVLHSVGIRPGHGRLSPAWQAAWGSWLSVSLLCTVIWILSGAGYPWPLWVAAPLGALLAGRWLMGAGPGGHDKDS
jgi:Domain of unknown function (DUF1707)